MRIISIALTLALVASRVSAQSQEGAWAQCSPTGQPAASIRACTDIIRSARSSREVSDAYTLRAAAYRRQGRFEQAIADFTKAIAFADDQLGRYLGYINRGNTYERMGRHDEAIADYTRAIALEPGQSPAYEQRARSYEAHGQREKAIADYQAALKINPSLASARQALLRLGATPN